MALAKDMQQATAATAYHEAITRFQDACPPIVKDRTAEIVGARARYSYKYADLAEIMAVVRPVLSRNGLSVSWKHLDAPGQVGAICLVRHALGHVEESGAVMIPIGQGDGRMNPAQYVGSLLSYAKRYALLAGLGLAPVGEDDDAHGADADTPRVTARRSSPASAAVVDPMTEERDKLLIQIGEIADALGLAPETRKEMWAERFGHSKPGEVDVAALAAMLADMRGEAADGAA